MNDDEEVDEGEEVRKKKAADLRHALVCASITRGAVRNTHLDKAALLWSEQAATIRRLRV